MPVRLVGERGVYPHPVRSRSTLGDGELGKLDVQDRALFPLVHICIKFLSALVTDTAVFI